LSQFLHLTGTISSWHKTFRRLPISSYRLWTNPTPGQIYLSPGLAKIAPWCLARRDSFQAKAPGLMVGVTAPSTLTAPTRRR